MGLIYLQLYHRRASILVDCRGRRCISRYQLHFGELSQSTHFNSIEVD